MGPAGAGGVIRDDNGEWLMGFFEYLGHCLALTVEIRAVIRGLKIAKELRAHRLWVRIDSRVLWGMLTNQNHGHPKYHFLVQQCRRLLQATDWEVKITHCFSGNKSRCGQISSSMHHRESESWLLSIPAYENSRCLVRRSHGHFMAQANS